MSSTPFRNIALLGATGNLGSKVLKALTSAGFNVTAIQRADSTNKVPSPIKSLKVDLSSQKDLAAAFKGQDVIVSALPNPRLSSDKIWMNAAIDAGVKRIVPSEFSTNLENKTSQKLPIVKDKVEIRKFVEELAESGKIEWTSVNNGPFMVSFIWTSGWMGPNPKNKTTKYHDGGEKIVGTSTLKRIAEGVAKVLAPEHAASTRNKSIYVYSTAMSEKKMTGIVAKASGIDVSEFKVDDVSIADVVKEAYGALEKGDMSKMMNFYIPFCFGDEYGGDFRDIAWNEKLGLKEMTDGEIEQLVKQWV